MVPRVKAFRQCLSPEEPGFRLRKVFVGVRVDALVKEGSTYADRFGLFPDHEGPQEVVAGRRVEVLPRRPGAVGSVDLVWKIKDR